jgi:hypothetical protein
MFEGPVVHPVNLLSLFCGEPWSWIVVGEVASENSSMKKPEPTFEVGDRIKFVLPSSSIEEGMVKAVFQTTAGTQLNVAFVTGLSASVEGTVGCAEVASAELTHCWSRSPGLSTIFSPVTESTTKNSGQSDCWLACLWASSIVSAVPNQTGPNPSRRNKS